MENFVSAEWNNRPKSILYYQKSSSNQKVFVAVYHFYLQFNWISVVRKLLSSDDIGQLNT